MNYNNIGIGTIKDHKQHLVIYCQYRHYYWNKLSLNSIAIKMFK